MKRTEGIAAEGYFRPVRAVLLLLSVQASVLWAQPLEPTLLWRIEAGTVAAPSYLYGTVHSRDERAYFFGDSVLAALDRCHVVAGELDLSAERELGMAILSKALLPDGQHLLDLYKKRDRERVKQALDTELGVMAPMVARVKPFYVLAMLMEGSIEGDRPEVLDDHLQKRGAANGQRVIGLETVDEQLAAIDAVPLADQARMLLDHIEHQGYANEMNAMLDAYAGQDLERLVEAAMKAGSMPDALEEAMLTTRNARMVQRMDSLIQQGEPVFFLVGAAHLPRPDGLIAGLRGRGLKVTAVVNPYRAPSSVPTER